MPPLSFLRRRSLCDAVQILIASNETSECNDKACRHVLYRRDSVMWIQDHAMPYLLISGIDWIYPERKANASVCGRGADTQILVTTSWLSGEWRRLTPHTPLCSTLR